MSQAELSWDLVYILDDTGRNYEKQLKKKIKEKLNRFASNVRRRCSSGRS